MIRYKGINSFLHMFIEYELQQNYIVIIGASVLLNRIANRNIYIYMFICVYVTYYWVVFKVKMSLDGMNALYISQICPVLGDY